eukprot:CAMPEP_0183390592 /NCGR_PEP_ID=MMETSP0370-20130417/5824_1 /TAXON_ID=268820 /ORGANISM="Peridinium aciculiferum, Strain PAER-2" /LENGTH=177 /DNA_ID=CAMNT_0025570131 /DNA_START=247 /DNA_END=778 /DNA_ORIENTATION=+
MCVSILRDANAAGRHKVQALDRGGAAEGSGASLKAVNHDLILRDEGCVVDEEGRDFFPDVPLELDDDAVLLVVDEKAVGLETLLQCPQNLIKVHLERPAALGELHLIGHAGDDGPGLTAVALLHADVHLARLVVLAVEARGTFEAVHGDEGLTRRWGDEGDRKQKARDLPGSLSQNG